MAVRRVVPNIRSEAAQESREFYGLLGFEEVMNHGWIMTLASPSSPAAQISFMTSDKTAPVDPEMSVEVDDVERLVRDCDIVYGAALDVDRVREQVRAALDRRLGPCVVRVTIYDPRVLHAVHGCTATAARRLAGDPEADPASRAAELEALLGRLRSALAPLVHPLNPLRARKARALRVLALLDECARRTRGLVAVAADPDASHDARLLESCRRVEAAVETLLGGFPERVLTAPAGVPERHPGAERALAHVHGLERALVALAAPLHGSSPGQARHGVLFG